MNKKDRENIKNLNKEVLDMVGLTVSNSIIVDQDTMRPITSRGKILKHSNGDTTPIHKGESQFNPVQDSRLTRELFDLFLQKEEEENDLYTQIYYGKTKGDKTAVELRTNDGIKTSEYYETDSLKYIDMMMQISGIQPNLEDIDNIKYPQQKKKKAGRK